MNKNLLIVILTFLGVYVFFPDLFKRGYRDVNNYGARWGKRVKNGSQAGYRYAKTAYQKRRAKAKAKASMEHMRKAKKKN